MIRSFVVGLLVCTRVLAIQIGAAAARARNPRARPVAERNAARVGQRADGRGFKRPTPSSNDSMSQSFNMTRTGKAARQAESVHLTMTWTNNASNPKTKAAAIPAEAAENLAPTVAQPNRDEDQGTMDEDTHVPPEKSYAVPVTPEDANIIIRS